MDSQGNLKITINDFDVNITRDQFESYCIDNQINFNDIHHIDIEHGILTIGSLIFSCLSELKSINLPDSLVDIGSFAFSKCDQLRYIEIPNKIVILNDSIFKGCSNLVSVRLPSKLKKIGISVFMDCVSLTDIILPLSVIEISDYAFQNCSSLISINIPNKLKKMGKCAFSNCINLKNIDMTYCKLKTIDLETFMNCGSLIEIKLPLKLKIIRRHAFYNCTQLEYIELPIHLKQIWQDVFSNCSRLQKFIIPYSLGNFHSRNSFEYCINNCNFLEFIVLPPTIITIDFDSSLYNIFTSLINTEEVDEIIKEEYDYKIKTKQIKEINNKFNDSSTLYLITEFMEDFYNPLRYVNINNLRKDPDMFYDLSRQIVYDL